jgi:hypothetical protein
MKIINYHYELGLFYYGIYYGGCSIGAVSVVFYLFYYFCSPAGVYLFYLFYSFTSTGGST